MNSINITSIFGPMRIPFLILSPVCVLLGVSTAVMSGSKINMYYLILIFIGALLSHISVNILNEYCDFKSGLDSNTKPTPFSGGSKTLPENPEQASIWLIIGVVAIILAVVIDLFL